MTNKLQSLLVLTNPRARKEMESVNREIGRDPDAAIRKLVDLRSKENSAATKLLNTDNRFVDSLGNSYHNWSLDCEKRHKPTEAIKGKANKKAAKRLLRGCT